MKLPFIATYHKGQPAVFDSTKKVYTVGFESFREARLKALELNEATDKEKQPYKRFRG